MLATAGVGSRRGIETWIGEGRIRVNGKLAVVGQKVSPQDRIEVDGRNIRLPTQAEPLRILLYRKRVGELVTRHDPDGRRTVFRKLPALDSGRWIAVGRLDINTSGLLLLTNHGELARRLMHPSYQIQRCYAVRVLGDISPEIRQKLLRGVRLEDGPARFERLISIEPPQTESVSANRWFEVELREGRNREVRRLFESQELQVSRLMRTAFGPIKLGRGIRAGGYREATAAEQKALCKAVDLDLSTLDPPAAGKHLKPDHRRKKSFR